MRRVAFLALTMAATEVGAEPVALAENALRELAIDKTVHLESPYGTLPVSFKADGTLSGKASGLLAAYLGSATDRGRWNVQGDRICQKFFKWFHGETHCMRVKADGRRITWRRDDGLSGTATIAANNAAPLEKPVGLGVPAEQMVAATEVAAPAPKTKPTTSPPRFAAASTASMSDALPATQLGTAHASETAMQRAAPIRVAALPPDAGMPLGSMDADAIGDRQPAAAHLAAVLAITLPPHALTGEMFRSRLRHGWCQSSATQGKVGAAAAPALLIVAQGGAPGATSERDLTGCLAITPPLTEIARAGAASK